jgi:hypothetical protein
MSIFEEMMAQYESSHNGKRDSGSQKTYDLKNYFNTILPKGVNRLTKRVRLLPPTEGFKTPFDTMMGHTKKVNGDWKTFPCLKDGNDEPCPFCEAREALLSTGKEEDKELAKQYSARQYYIVKVIDRDNETDGVKFWRFKHNYKQQGIYDKMMAAIKTAGHDITDINEGRDFNIEIIRDGQISVVQAISVALDKTPLSTSQDKVTEWTSDTRTWEDVYSTRSYDYLAIIVKGDVPVWDKDAKTYVGKLASEGKNDLSEDNDSTDLEEELEIGITNANSLNDGNETVEDSLLDDDEENLPF